MGEGFKFSFNGNGRVDKKPSDSNKEALSAQNKAGEAKKTLEIDQQILELANKFVVLDLKNYDLNKKLSEISARMMDLSDKLSGEDGYSKEIKLLEKGQSDNHNEEDGKEYDRLEDEFENLQLELDDVNEARAQLRFEASELSPTAEDYFMQMVLTLEDASMKGKAHLN